MSINLPTNKPKRNGSWKSCYDLLGSSALEAEISNSHHKSQHAVKKNLGIHEIKLNDVMYYLHMKGHMEGNTGWPMVEIQIFLPSI